MSVPAPDLGAALLAALDEQAIRQLAERLRPYLDGERPDGSGLLAPAQVARRLGLHPKTVVRMARDGRIPAVKVGNGWRFDPDRLLVEQPTRRERSFVRHARACGHADDVPASVRAIRGENATSERGAR